MHNLAYWYHRDIRALVLSVCVMRVGQSFRVQWDQKECNLSCSLSFFFSFVFCSVEGSTKTKNKIEALFVTAGILGTGFVVLTCYSWSAFLAQVLVFFIKKHGMFGTKSVSIFTSNIKISWRAHVLYKFLMDRSEISGFDQSPGSKGCLESRHMRCA